MEAWIQAHTFAGLLLAMVVTLFGKYTWDRYFSQTSRVTRTELADRIKLLNKECELNRTSCNRQRDLHKTDLEAMIHKQDTCLSEIVKGEAEDARIRVQDDAVLARKRIDFDADTARRRMDTRRALFIILMSLLKICNALHDSGVVKSEIDCTEISKMMVEMGVIE